MVSSPRFVVCPFVLLCREGAVTWWRRGVCLAVCAGASVAEVPTAFDLGVSHGMSGLTRKMTG